MNVRTIGWCLTFALTFCLQIHAVSGNFNDTDSLNLVEFDAEDIPTFPEPGEYEPDSTNFVGEDTQQTGLTIPSTSDYQTSNTIPQNNVQSAGDYLAGYNSISPSEGSEFNYNPEPQYEDVASLRDMARTKEGWDRLKSVGLARASKAYLNGVARKRAQRNPRNYNPNLFHSSTWSCAWDRVTWVHNENHDSPNCIKAVGNGW